MIFYLKKRKRLLAKITVGLALFFLGAGSFAVFSFLSRKFFSTHWAEQSQAVIVLMTLISLLAYKPVDRWVTHFFNQYLFKKKSYAHLVLMNLTKELDLIFDFQEMANLIVNTFGEVMNLKTVALLTASESPGQFEISAAYGWPLSEHRRFRCSKKSPLLLMIRTGGEHVLVRNQVAKSFTWQETNRLLHDFDRLRANWVIPFFVKDEFVGLLAFSAFDPERTFDDNDFYFFREFAGMIAKNLYKSQKFLELKRYNDQLQDAQSRILQKTKLDAIEQLATGIAHEIHNPLTIISGKAQVLLLQSDKKKNDSRVEDVLKTIVKQTKRAADITRKLLMFSQSSGAPKEEIQLEQVLEDTIALVSYQTSLDGIRILKTLDHKLPPLFANVHEMREIFLNLILNAVQAIGTEGTIRVLMNYAKADELIEIQISDTGKGIEPENLGKVFNPFFTTHHSALGLGLFVTQQIVHHYGGSIRVESNPDEGSLFIVQLPCGDISRNLTKDKRSSGISEGK
ncbi:MAG: GAF domain-containing protein [Candidatus Omnitrophica bacterium]|nr:GAF domain-containing protein [Candidatus Omnitrophota bacterium]